MKLSSLLVALAALAAPTLSPAAMGVDYYRNARDVCQWWAHMKVGKPYPIDARRAAAAKVVPIDKGNALEVTTSDEANGQKSECRCTVIPGDADLYPAVRNKNPPVCTLSKV